MKTQIAITIIVFCITLISYSQEYDCSIAYKHMSGYVGNDIMIVDLQLSGNEIIGSCVFPDRKFVEGELQGLTLTQGLRGSVDSHGVASLEAYIQNKLVGVYSGIFGQVFKGTYRREGSNATKTFHLNEDCGQSSICFKGYCMDRDSVLLDSVGSPQAHLKLSLLLPKDDQATPELRQCILDAFFGREINDSLPDDSLLKVYCKKYFRKYVEANRDLYDGGHSFNWEIIVGSTVSMNRNALLVYRTDNYAYTGGAHGMGISRFVVFDLEANKQLKLDDIFAAGYEYELTKLLERKYRESYYLEPEQSLSEAGLFENEIPPSQNFFLTENSIGFYYNPYKLAPYAFGAIQISLLLEELIPLMQIDSPVMRIVR